MQEYRAYIVDPSGHVLERIDMMCSDEEVAKERARQLVDGHDVELWQGDHRIATFGSPLPPGAPERFN
jgi:hypothetical protein